MAFLDSYGLSELWAKAKAYFGRTLYVSGSTLYLRNSSGSNLSSVALPTSAGSLSRTVLYNGGAALSDVDSGSGSNGTISLSQSAADFKRFDIYFTDNNSTDHSGQSIWWPNGKNVGLYTFEAASTTSTLIRRTRYAISGTSMTPSNGAYVLIFGNNDVTHQGAGTNFIKITRVEGWK